MILLTAIGFGVSALTRFREAPVLGLLIGLVVAQLIPAKSACSIDAPEEKPE